MRVLDLFSGIGGFSLGLRMAGGFETVQLCEIDPYCQKVLAKNFPGVPIHDDVRTLAPATGSADIITGGFPCQPFSVAGKRSGTSDDRDLWPEMARVIEAVRPAWVIGENVAGFVNMELDRSLSDLESLGYACQSFVIPACAVDARHRRDRVWIVAHAGRLADESGGVGGVRDGAPSSIRGEVGKQWIRSAATDGGEVVAHAERQRGCGRHAERQDATDAWESSGSQEPRGWDTESGICRVADGIPNRVHRLRGLGNAVVPQLVAEIGKAIIASERVVA